jgi:hypothetical protein
MDQELKAKSLWLARMRAHAYTTKKGGNSIERHGIPMSRFFFLNQLSPEMGISQGL